MLGQFIGNKSSNLGNHIFKNYNAAEEKDGEIEVLEATKAEINAAAKLADRAYWKYKNISDIKRAAFLEAIASEIEALGDDLIKTAMYESALPEARLVGERGRTIGQLKLFAAFIQDGSWRKQIIDEALPDRTPLPRPHIMQQQIALGPVAVFGASNFPLAFSVAGGDTVSALAAGCPVVFKAHPAHPKTCQLVAGAIISAIQKTKMPEGTFSMVHGKSTQVGSSLVKHPLFKAVGFTGSYGGGKALFDLAVRRKQPIPVYAEMGSVNPVFFMDGAFENAQLAAQFAGSITMGVGQFCTNPGVFVIEKKNKGFIAQLKEELGKLQVGKMLTSGIKSAYLNGVSKQREADCMDCSGNWDGSLKPHLLVISAAEALKNKALLHEVFGPSSVGIVAEKKAEILKLAKALDGQLTATLFGTKADLNENRALQDVLETKVGRLIFNNFPTGVEVCHAMVHGGPFPSTTDSRSTSVGTQAIYRFTRPMAWQGFE